MCLTHYGCSVQSIHSRSAFIRVHAHDVMNLCIGALLKTSICVAIFLGIIISDHRPAVTDVAAQPYLTTN